MKITPIFSPARKKRPMRVAGFMSGSGTNIIRLLEREKRLEKDTGQSPYNVIFIFSDRSDGGCRGEGIALKNNIPYFSYDIRAFHKSRGIKRTVLSQEGLAARREFDRVAERLLEAFEIDVIALGGYMSYTTLTGCVNVHPADLSILTEKNKRKYTGDNAVFDAILSGEKTLRSSTLWTDQGVDTGPLLMVSKPLKVVLPQPIESLRNDKEKLKQVVDDHQERLKEAGDWEILPLTIEMISRGRFGFDQDFNVYVDEKPVLSGYRL